MHVCERWLIRGGMPPFAQRACSRDLLQQAPQLLYDLCKAGPPLWLLSPAALHEGAVGRQAGKLQGAGDRGGRGRGTSAVQLARA